jgi:hypothetical protein
MHGGRRNGAGRPAGSGWKPETKIIRPKITALRAETVAKQAAIIGGETDPLTVVSNMVLDPSLDVGTRLSAAAVCLPYLYPRLSASQIDARVTTTKVDSADLLRRLDERLTRLAPPNTIDARVEELPRTINVGSKDDV